MTGWRWTRFRRWMTADLLVHILTLLTLVYIAWKV